MMFDTSEMVIIDYTNYKGERYKRMITPVSIVFTKNEYHPKRQWLLYALDEDKGMYRFFAIKDIHSWRTV